MLLQPWWRFYRRLFIFNIRVNLYLYSSLFAIYHRQSGKVVLVAFSNPLMLPVRQYGDLINARINGENVEIMI